jgi:hypothetical protein
VWQWWHRAWFDGPQYIDVQVPIPAIVKGNVRVAIDRHVGPIRGKTRKKTTGARTHRHSGDNPHAVFVNRAVDLRKRIASAGRS